MYWLLYMFGSSFFLFFFFFNDTATTEIYTLSLHDALPIWWLDRGLHARLDAHPDTDHDDHRSEEHTSELQSPCNLVCRLLLEKKKNRSKSNFSFLLYPQSKINISGMSTSNRTS